MSQNEAKRLFVIYQGIAQKYQAKIDTEQARQETARKYIRQQEYLRLKKEFEE